MRNEGKWGDMGGNGGMDKQVERSRGGPLGFFNWEGEETLSLMSCPVQCSKVESSWRRVCTSTRGAEDGPVLLQHSMGLLLSSRTCNVKSQPDRG